MLEDSLRELTETLEETGDWITSLYERTETLILEEEDLETVF